MSFNSTNATKSFWSWSYDNELPCHKEEEEVEGNSAEETQWHGITVSIYVCYPHPRWGQQLLLVKPKSAGESQ